MAKLVNGLVDPPPDRSRRVNPEPRVHPREVTHLVVCAKQPRARPVPIIWRGTLLLERIGHLGDLSPALGSAPRVYARMTRLGRTLELLEPKGKAVSVRVILLCPRQPDQRTCDRLEALLEQGSVVEHQQPLRDVDPPTTGWPSSSWHR